MKIYNLEKALKIFLKQGCELLAKEYKDCDTSMSYICSCGNASNSTLYNFMNHRKGCRSCMQKGDKNHQHGKTLTLNRRKKSSLPLNKNPNWKNGRYLTIPGYVYIRVCDNHPYKNKQGYIAEHRLVMESKLGRYLNSKEVVHHINGIKNDNRIQNLMLFANQSDHIKFHKKLYNYLFYNCPYIVELYSKGYKNE